MPDSYTVPEDGKLTVDVAGGTLHNDIDAEGDALTASLMQTTQHGQLAFREDGSFDYEPDPDYAGADAFTYRITDSIDEADEVGMVELTVQPVNDPPVGRGDLYLTFVGQPLAVSTEQGVLLNDLDIDSVNLTAELVSSPRHGTLTLDPSGSLTYAPAVGFTGTDDFRYRIQDGQDHFRADTRDAGRREPGSTDRDQ